MRTLWMVGGGAEAVPGIQRAKEMGLHVVVSDGNPDAPGLALADDRVVVSTYDVRGTVAAARRYHRQVRPVDGVLCVASDVPLTVAEVAAELGLPGIPVESARLASDKLAMKEHFSARGIPIPWFQAVRTPGEVREAVRARGLPLVVKPVDSRGARGVVRLTENVDPEWAYRQAATLSPTGRVMVEEYLPGPQISTESILIGGTGVTPGFSDRNYEFLDRFSPYFIENGGEQPSRLSLEDRERVSRLAEKAGQALGIRTGIVKGDLVLTSEGPKVIEIATRLSGGWFCTDQIPLATGVDLVGAAIRLALGEPVELKELRPENRRGVAIRYFFPPAGVVKAIDGIGEARALPYVHRVGLFVKEGDRLDDPTNHTQRAGFVITTGESRDEAVERAVHVVNNIVTIRVQPP